jgi:phosphoglycerate kinase
VKGKAMKTLDNMDLAGKRVFLRVDYNVPLDHERRVADDTRIRATLPSLRKALEGGARVILASHLGRPKGKVVVEMSLQPAAECLAEILGQPVPLAPDCTGLEVEKWAADLQPGSVLLLENLRFHAGEEANDPIFSQSLAALADVYVNDAFAVSHRAHASVHGITRYVKVCAAGYQLQKEIEYFRQALQEPKRPVAVVIGGAKVSSKIGLLENLIPRVDCLLIGGAMANTFLKACGVAVGSSLVEDGFLDMARQLLEKAQEKGVQVVLPVDAVVAPGLNAPEAAREVAIDQVPADEQILDVGTRTLELYCTTLKNCPTIVWNGPLGAFETRPFHRGTFALAEFLGGLPALTVIGGGDSAAAVQQAGVAEKVSYVSTGGGAFLELMEGKILPGIAALEECSQRS